MKKLLWIVTLMLILGSAEAQFTKATLQATGLTCAMCNNAINKALQKVSFVESVRSDIKNASFDIVFKANSAVDIDDLKKAVEDAGFSVGGLKLVTVFNNTEIVPDKHIKIGNNNFHFINVTAQILNGEQVLTVVDKNFITEKQFKKMSSATKMSCLQTGKAGSCCVKDGLSEGERVYHVTI
jgi:copper chaperone CopZ